MRIVTVNVPETYLEAIEKLVDSDKGLYPSRSELIRVAVRAFLLRELRLVKKMAFQKADPQVKEFDDENYVRVPVERTNKENQPVRSFKTYKILRRLE